MCNLCPISNLCSQELQGVQESHTNRAAEQSAAAQQCEERTKGAEVQAAQLQALLDEQVVNLEAAEARLHTAEAALGEERGQRAALEQHMSEAQSQHARTEAHLPLLQAEMDRMQQLLQVCYGDTCGTWLAGYRL
jgi:chromosome segregation ATPase